MKKPYWVCYRCGKQYGTESKATTTWHMGICDCCGEEAAVTEARDFNYLPKWKEAK